jgi:hypothetical protein
MPLNTMPHQTDSATSRQTIRRMLNRRCWESTKVDCSSNAVGNEEVTVVERLINGEELVESRFYYAEERVYCTYWYWHDDAYTRQSDVPIRHLWSRGIIRPVWCAGGFTWIVLTNAAREALGLAPTKRPRPIK